MQVDLECEHVEHEDSYIEIGLAQNGHQFEYVWFMNVKLDCSWDEQLQDYHTIWRVVF